VEEQPAPVTLFSSGVVIVAALAIFGMSTRTAVRAAPQTLLRLRRPRTGDVRMASTLDTMRTLPGPDNTGFGHFAQALEHTGVANELMMGEFTILAPTDAAFQQFMMSGKQISPDLLKYHIIQGRKGLDMLNADQQPSRAAC
jgi:uncharacterized surface protein with fasciclin (FAS1) repeats